MKYTSPFKQIATRLILFLLFSAYTTFGQSNNTDPIQPLELQLKKAEQQAEELTRKITRQEKQNKDTLHKIATLEEQRDAFKNKPPLYDQITFANGASFVGKVVKIENDTIKIISASNKEKTGPLRMIKEITFHQKDLTPEEFPKAKKRPTQTPKAKKASTASAQKVQLNNIKISVKKPVREKDDGVEKKGRTTYYSQASQTVQLNAKVSYNNLSTTLKNTTLEVYVLTRSLTNKKKGYLIIKETHDIPEADRDGYEISTRSVNLSYTENSFQKNAGKKYYGYLVVLKDKDGKILLKKASKTRIENVYKELQTLSTGRLIKI